MAFVKETIKVSSFEIILDNDLVLAKEAALMWAVR